jgi:hypothetical protein
MRVITPGRIIGIASILVLIGVMPTILAVGAEIISRSHEWWPEQLSIESNLTRLSEFWRSLSGAFGYVRAAGFVLLFAGITWALLVRMDRMPWARSEPHAPPERIGAVLLKEASVINGATPPADVQEKIDAFDNQRQVEADNGADDAPLNEVSPAAYQWLNGLDRAALCLSGGGIRSASFALGVLQALAVHPRSSNDDRHVAEAKDSLLAQFTYLSTVSGGGYIGSWFSAWVARHKFPFVWSSLVRRHNEGRDPGLEPRAVA